MPRKRTGMVEPAGKCPTADRVSAGACASTMGRSPRLRRAFQAHRGAGVDVGCGHSGEGGRGAWSTRCQARARVRGWRARRAAARSRRATGRSPPTSATTSRGVARAGAWRTSIRRGMSEAPRRARRRQDRRSHDAGLPRRRSAGSRPRAKTGWESPCSSDRHPRASNVRAHVPDRGRRGRRHGESLHPSPGRPPGEEGQGSDAATDGALLSCGAPFADLGYAYRRIGGRSGPCSSSRARGSARSLRCVGPTTTRARSRSAS